MQTFQGEPRRKMLKSIAVGLMCPTLLWLTEHAFDCLSGFALGVGIEVGINVCSGAHVAMPELHLNDFHIDILCDQERRTGVAQVVESDRSQSVFLQHLGKPRGHVVWL